jgi:DNA-binding phage protein
MINPEGSRLFAAIKHLNARLRAERNPRGDVKFSGICRVARKMRVSRIHLYEVLKGNRVSPRLKSAYEQHLKQLREAA